MPSNPHFVLPVPSSSYRTPIRYPQWGAEVGTFAMINPHVASNPSLSSPSAFPSSSYRTPIRYPRWEAGGGHARHVQLPTGRPTPLSPQHVILERSEESPGCPTSNPVPIQPPPTSSYRTPIRYQRWGAEVGTPDMYNSQPAGATPLSSPRAAMTNPRSQ